MDNKQQNANDDHAVQNNFGNGLFGIDAECSLESVNFATTENRLLSAPSKDEDEC